MDETKLKHRLLDVCREYVTARIGSAVQAMNFAQEAANEESKSSAGDKYETGRSLMQIEREKAAHQVEEALKLKRVLDHIDPSSIHDKIALGSIVLTPTLRIFIAIGAGKINMNGDEFWVITPSSPVGKSLTGLGVNEKFTFSKQVHIITKIF